MRSSTRYLSALAVLALGLLSLIWRASAQPRIPSRSVERVIVHGRDATSTRNEATSFELLGGNRPESKVTPAPVGAARLIPQPVGSGFDALEDPVSVPSDTTGARGDSFIVAAVNTQVAVYDLNGKQVVAPIQLEDLFPAPDNTAFDPKVVYDQYDDTFVVVYLVQRDSPRLSKIVAVAIPNATASNTSTWCANSFKGDAVPGGKQLWADYPGLGFNDTRITITTNQFTFPSSRGRFSSSQVLTIDKSGLYDCAQPDPVATVFAGSATRDDKGNKAFTLRPAETVGSAPGSQLMLSFGNVQGRGDYLTVWRITPTSSGFALKKASFRTGKVSLPPLGTQQGGGLNTPNGWWDAGDTRFVNAFYDADRNELFTAHPVLKNLKPDTLTGGYPESAIRWYEVDPATKLKNSAIVRKGTIGNAEVDVGWPSVATDSSGVLFVTYNRASEPRNEFLSAWVSTIQPSSTADSELLLKSGLTTYNAIGGPERWGDYTAINRDPANGQNVATFNQFAQSNDQWRQLISLVTDN